MTARPRPMLPTVNLPAPRCATCTYWDPTSMGLGMCDLPGVSHADSGRPMYVEGEQLYTRLDFGCIFHERAAEL